MRHNPLLKGEIFTLAEYLCIYRISDEYGFCFEVEKQAWLIEFRPIVLPKCPTLQFYPKKLLDYVRTRLQARGRLV